MKKLLLMSLAAFCFVSFAAAQDPAKVAKKKELQVKLKGAAETESARAASNNEKKKAIEADKIKSAGAVKGSKSTLAAEKAN